MLLLYILKSCIYEKDFESLLWFISRHYQKLNVFLTEHLKLYALSSSLTDFIGVRLTVSSIPVTNCIYICFLNTCLLMGLDAFLGLLIMSIWTDCIFWFSRCKLKNLTLILLYWDATRSASSGTLLAFLVNGSGRWKC